MLEIFLLSFITLIYILRRNAVRFLTQDYSSFFHSEGLPSVFAWWPLPFRIIFAINYVDYGECVVVLENKLRSRILEV